MPPKRKGRKSKGTSAKKSKSSKSASASVDQDSSPLSSPPLVPSPPLPLAPVQKCPNEILLAIFNLYTSENPRVIRRLLLVCKQWYNLAINTTRLWTHLPFKIPPPEIRNPKRTFESATVAFIKACLKRAGNSLLHIEASFVFLVSSETFYRHMEYSDFDFFDMEEFMDLNGMDGFDVDKIDEIEEIAVPDRFIDVPDMQRAFSLLTGKNGSLMHRWASLELILPMPDDRFDPDGRDHHLQHHIYKMLTGPTPNLTRLSIISAEQHVDLSGNRGILPNLSALKFLYLDSVFELPSFKKAPIENLQMPIDDDYEDDWPIVCRSGTLKTLDLRKSRYDRNASPRVPWPSLHLPLLHTLELDDGNWGTFLFDFPSLKRLRVRTSKGYSLSGLPNLQPESVKLIISALFDSSNESEVEGWLKQIILKYPSIKLLEISTSAEAVCDNVVARLKEELTWPSTLKRVRIISKGRGVQTLWIAAL